LDAEEEAAKDAEMDRVNASIRQESRERAARRQQQATNSVQVALPNTGSAINPVVAGL
jgi:hypothetical protein